MAGRGKRKREQADPLDLPLRRAALGSGAVVRKTRAGFDAVNDNLDEIKMRYGSNARKIFADIYIDDRACVPEAALAWQQGKQADG